jgi:hypothetical protein
MLEMFSPQKEELKRERVFQDSMGKDGVPGLAKRSERYHREGRWIGMI